MSFLVGIPVFNEEKHVLHVIGEVQRYTSHIFVVDDGSTDTTSELLGKIRGIDVLKHAENKGYGASLTDIFTYACRNGYEYVVTMDCDAQHEPHQILDFVDVAPGVDIVSGSRYLQKNHGDHVPPPDRRGINVEITKLINEATGYGLTDAFCGFKTYNVASVRKLCLTETGYGMPLQLWLQAAKKGLTMREIPVSLIYGDPSRGFGSGLDDPGARLSYYLDVIERERQAQPPDEVCDLCRRPLECPPDEES